MRRVWLLSALGLGLMTANAQAQVSCSYAISPILDFGTVTGLPTPEISVTATISVTCSALLSVNHRVCLSIPAGTAGNSIDDREMDEVAGTDSVKYQLYTDPGHTDVWGELGNNHPPVAIDFPLLVGQRTEVRTIFGHLPPGQTGVSVGTYQSNLSPIARRESYLLAPPSCQNVTSNQATLPTLPVQLVIEPDCTISANPLDFGTANAVGGQAATSNLSVTCTDGGAYSITLDGGDTGDVNDRRMTLGSGSDTIAYQLYQDPGHTQIWGDTPNTGVDGTGDGTAQSIPVYGLVPAQGPKPVGIYDDTITATITF